MASQEEPIIVNDDEDIDVVDLDDIYSFPPSAASNPIKDEDDVIYLDEDGYLDGTVSDSEDDLQILSIRKREPHPLQDPTQEQPGIRGKATKRSRSDSSLPRRLPSLRFEENTHCALEDATIVTIGDTVEIQCPPELPPDGLHSGDFLRVKHIIRDTQTNEITLRGQRLRRTKYLGQLFDWKTNEVVLTLDADSDNDTSPWVQGMEDLPLSEIVKKRDMVITSLPFPRLSWREDFSLHVQGGRAEEMKEDIFHNQRLVCRWVAISYWDTAAQKKDKTRRCYSGEVRRIYAHEADHRDGDRGKALDHDILEAKPGRASQATPKADLAVPSTPHRRARSPSVEILEDFKPQSKRVALDRKKHRYTFADGFHGAGGASRGAAMAGLKIIWGFDKDSYCHEAYKSNFPGANSYEMEAADFPPKGVTDIYADILHVSPSCAFFSSAHTKAGPYDQGNYNTIFTVGPLIGKVRPRIVTLEETDNLVKNREHHKTFKRLLNSIISEGYNIRYKILDFAEYGVPQRRMRLIIIAARHGIPLPPFPKPTHGDPGTGLLPYVSVWQALEPLRSNPRHWDPYHEPRPSQVPTKKPYNPQRSLLKHCITTGGGDNFHFSGKRPFTVRELALLQTLPMVHEFAGPNSEAKKQVGNACPPVTLCDIYKHCTGTLRATDDGLIDVESSVSEIQSVLSVLASPKSSAATSKEATPSSIGSGTNEMLQRFPALGLQTPTKPRKSVFANRGNTIILPPRPASTKRASNPRAARLHAKDEEEAEFIDLTEDD